MVVIKKYIFPSIIILLILSIFAAILIGYEPNKTVRREISAEEIYEQYKNSVVVIKTTYSPDFWSNIGNSTASGSGLIYKSDGYILTNYHVVSNAESIVVTLYDNTELTAEVVDYDEIFDIALLKVESDELSPCVFGSPENLQVGEAVYAIGSPYTDLTFSMTAGIISGLNREFPIVEDNPIRLIQTDCAINAGNSGGPLLNNKGEVVGIINAKYVSNSGNVSETIDNISFAIPLTDILLKTIDGMLPDG